MSDLKIKIVFATPDDSAALSEGTRSLHDFRIGSRYVHTTSTIDFTIEDEPILDLNSSDTEKQFTKFTKTIEYDMNADSDLDVLCFYDGSAWKRVTPTPVQSAQ